MALTVAPVPTGMKAGVRITPRGIRISPTRAAPSVFVTVKVKVSDMPVVNRHPGSPFHIEPICHSGASEARARNP